jgi:glycosyltransferase involved in cell wall biosynthesis
MRILQFISSTGFFGAENVVLQLALSLKKLEVDTTVGIVLNTRNPCIDLLDAALQNEIAGVSFKCRGKIDYQLVRDLRRFLKERQIDVIHSHGYKSNIYAFLAAMGLPVKLVSTCHNWIEPDKKMKFYSSLDRFVLKRFDQIAAVSLQVAERLRQSKIDPAKIQKIDNGIDVEVFYPRDPNPGLLEEFKIAGGQLVIGSVGRMSEEKGHRYLIEAFRILKGEFPGIKLILVGDGPLKEELESSYAGPDIIFAGNRRDIPEIYSIMDIFVLPSLTEGLPMVLLESMASGRAVIASRVGEIDSVVNDNVSGLLVTPGSVNELSESLAKLLLSPDLLNKLGCEASRTVLKKYSSESMGRAYLDIYR